MSGAKRIVAALVALIATAAFADVATNTAPKKPLPNPKRWVREGDLGELPKRVTDSAPLSDQANTGGWIRVETLSDEFQSSALDTNKWHVGLEWWKGRQPAAFLPKNVTVSDGQLHLTMRKETLDESWAKQGYTNYSSAALHTIVRAGYGYYEVRAKVMNSAGSSSFWFQQEAEKGWSTEIDVFEIGGKAKSYEQTYGMNMHVMHTPDDDRHWSVGRAYKTPWRFADDYHVFGLDWQADEVRYFLDGVLVSTVENTHWHNPLFLIFDSETMGNWLGMPEDADLPSTFSIDYLRAWRRP